MRQQIFEWTGIAPASARQFTEAPRFKGTAISDAAE
jgi:hypothetical protein